MAMSHLRHFERSIEFLSGIKTLFQILTRLPKLNGNAAANWSITNVAGTTIMSGTNATEADILKKAKSQQLKGVFIINMDGAKRKTVIK